MSRVQGTELLRLAPAEAWRRLNDPDALAAAIPGCSGFQRDGEHRYRTSITVAVGAVKSAYAGTVEYRDVVPPERCTIHVQGRGDKGAIDGQGCIALAEGSGGTEVSYEGTFKITGPVAAVGQRLAPGISRKVIVETLRNLERQGAPSPSPEKPRADPPVPVFRRLNARVAAVALAVVVLLLIWR